MNEAQKSVQRLTVARAIESFLWRSLLALPPATLRRVLGATPWAAGQGSTAGDLARLWPTLTDEQIRQLSNAYFCHVHCAMAPTTTAAAQRRGSERGGDTRGAWKHWFHCWPTSHSMRRQGYEKTLSSMSSGVSGLGENHSPQVVTTRTPPPAAARRVLSKTSHHPLEDVVPDVEDVREEVEVVGSPTEEFDTTSTKDCLSLGSV
jgi:hypothetical protein